MTNITETDRDEIVITKSYTREREKAGTDTNNDDITKGYN